MENYNIVINCFQQKNKEFINHFILLWMIPVGLGVGGGGVLKTGALALYTNVMYVVQERGNLWTWQPLPYIHVQMPFKSKTRNPLNIGVFTLLYTFKCHLIQKHGIIRTLGALIHILMPFKSKTKWNKENFALNYTFLNFLA